MDIQDKQQLANLLEKLLGDNCTDIELPPANDDQNSIHDEHPLSPTWAEEFLVLRNSDPRNTVRLEGDRCELYAYNFILDDEPVHIVALEYDYAYPDGTVLLKGHCKDARDMIDAWLGMTSLSQHEGHAIQWFAKMAGYGA